MNLFYGCFIAMMGGGHLLAVSVAWARGELGGSPLLLYPLGVGLFVPAVLLLVGLERGLTGPPEGHRRLVAFNAWLGVFLMATGIHNGPLALSAGLNVAHLLHRRPAIGWGIAALALVVNSLLLVGGIAFAVRGGTFEDLAGMEPS